MLLCGPDIDLEAVGVPSYYFLSVIVGVVYVEPSADEDAVCNISLSSVKCLPALNSGTFMVVTAIPLQTI